MGTLFRKYWPLFFITAFLFLPKFTFAADWVNVGFADKTIQATFVNPKNKEKILVGVAGGASNDRNYITENGGQTWTPVSMGAVTNCNQFVMNPKLDTEYWAACSNGLYHSTDSGRSFQRIPKYTNNILTIIMAKSGRLYITYTNNGLDYSDDGILWSDLRVPGTASQPYLYLNSTNEKQIFVSKNGSDAPGLYRSNDGGLTWLLVYNISPVRTGVFSMVFLDNGSKVCGTTALGYGCSLDYGSTWSSFVSPNLSKPSEPEHSFMASQNPDDPTNLIIFTVGWTGQDPKIYSYEGGAALPKIFEANKLTSSISISQGVIFSWAKNATWQKGLWRNDGVIVIPEYLKKHPVIIVPGILGSWFVPSTGKMTIDPILKTYDDLYYSFVNAGYEPDKYVFTFPYQWRNDNKYTAALLANKIKEAKLKSGSNKVDIIAHSMGGLVARFYAESDIYDNDINQIFFLGTPQLGSTGAYPIWETGFTGYEEAFFGMFLRFVLVEEAATNKYFGENAVRDYIHNEVTSVGQTLPVYSYLNSNIYPLGHPINSELELLNSNAGLLATRGIKIVNIIGDTGPSTLGGLNVVSYDGQPQWEYGEPIGLSTGNIYDGVGFVHGDGTVSVESQSFIPGKDIYLDGVEHIDIPRSSTKTIFKELSIGTNPLITTAINTILMIKAYSPVDFYVLAPDGKRVGFNNNGTAFSEIDGAFYTGNASETEFMTIPNPLPGEYKVMTFGTGTGSYEIEATYADGSKNSTVSSSYLGQATPGKEDKILVELTPELGMIEAKIEDKTPPVTTLEITGNKVGDYYNTQVVVSFSATDAESGVEKTEYSLDGNIWQDYVNPIVFNQDGEVHIIYRSVDKSGNIEIDQSALIRLDTTNPTVKLFLAKTSFTHWDNLVMDCQASDSYSGLREFSLTIDGVVVDCLKPYSLFTSNFGEHKVEYSAIDNAGNVTKGETIFKVIANYTSTLRDVLWLYENKHFKNRGETVSILAHLEVAQIFDVLRDRKLSDSFLSQAMTEVEKLKQKGKLTVFGYDMISRDIKYILEGK